MHAFVREWRRRLLQKNREANGIRRDADPERRQQCLSEEKGQRGGKKKESVRPQQKKETVRKEEKAEAMCQSQDGLSFSAPPLG